MSRKIVNFPFNSLHQALTFLQTIDTLAFVLKNILQCNFCHCKKKKMLYQIWKLFIQIKSKDFPRCKSYTYRHVINAEIAGVYNIKQIWCGTCSAGAFSYFVFFDFKLTLKACPCDTRFSLIFNKTFTLFWFLTVIPLVPSNCIFITLLSSVFGHPSNIHDRTFPLHMLLQRTSFFFANDMS